MDDAIPQTSDPRMRMHLLWTRAQPGLTAFIGSIVRDYHEAQDVLQKVAVVAFERFNDYDEQRSFTAWTIGIARNIVLKSRRTHARDRHVFDDEAVRRIAAAYEAIEPEIDPIQAAMNECLRQVRGRGRQLLMMRYAQEMSASYIAKRMGMTAVSVRVTLHRVRHAVRDCIDRRLASESES